MIMTTEELDLRLAALEVTANRAKKQSDGIPQAVEAAREAGATWPQIAKALGITRQAAWQRYRKE